MRAELDFRRLFEGSPSSCVLLEPNLTIVAVTDAYLAATLTKREAILGRNILEVFPPNPDDVNADGARNFRASFERVLATKAPDRMAIQKYDVRRPSGELEVRYWLPLNSPMLSANGTVEYVVHQVDDVTEWAQRHAALDREREVALRELTERSDQRYRDLLDAAPDAMLLVDRERRIEMVNAEAERIFGYGRDELIGESLDLLIPEAARGVHADHMAQYFRSPVARSMGTDRALYARRKDGTLLPVEVSLGPVRTERGIAVSAAVRDVTERVRLFQRLKGAVEAMDDAFVLFGDDGRVVICNNAYRRLLGLPDETVLRGRSHTELLDLFIATIDFPDDDARNAFRQSRTARFRTPSQRTPFDVRTRDGRNLRVIVRPTQEGGFITTAIDLTAEERRNEELRAAHAAAAAGSAAKTEFLSSMSHELRTPLNAVLGFAQLLQNDRKNPLTERQQERVRRILSGGEQLLRLVEDILDLAQIEAGRVAISVEPVRVDDVLTEVKRTLEPLQTRIGIELTLVPHEEVPPIAVDRMRYAQILTNFCSNALKYNRPGGTVRIVVERPTEDQVRVVVRDTGIGIPLAKQGLLFQPFQRAGQETGPIEGTGIGLVVTRKLAMLMNAEIGFESVEGVGSAFWVDVPTHTGAVARATDRPPRAAAPPRVGGIARKVLYVEDNPGNVAFMEEVVATLDDVALETATTAEHGVELALEHRPDVIVMDVHLAGKMSGLDAVGALRATSARTIPVVGLSAAASTADRERALSAGFVRYLTKPVNVQELVEVLESLL